ncbi:hypothetical protein ACHAXH_005719 [Discostella pseudostelligera]
MSSWNASFVAESLLAMIQREQTVYRSSDYLETPSPTPSLRIVDEVVRMKMVDWCYSFIDVCHFEREIVAVAMEMVDRFLSMSNKAEAVLCDRLQFQLLTVTSLYIAVKTHGESALGIDFFCSISCDIYSVDEIEAMERTLLHELSWCISPQTCVQMANHILALVSSDVRFEQSIYSAILDEVMYQAEHAVRNYYFATQRQSTVAMAAIFNTLERLDKQNGQAVVRSLLSIIDEEFDSLEIILDIKSRLNNLVYGQEGDDSAIIDPLLFSSTSAREQLGVSVH